MPIPLFEINIQFIKCLGKLNNSLEILNFISFYFYTKEVIYLQQDTEEDIAYIIETII